MCMLFNPYVFDFHGARAGVVENGCNRNGAGAHHACADHFKDLRLFGYVGDLTGIEFYTAVAHDEVRIVLSFINVAIRPMPTVQSLLYRQSTCPVGHQTVETEMLPESMHGASLRQKS